MPIRAPRMRAQPGRRQRQILALEQDAAAGQPARAARQQPRIAIRGQRLAGAAFAHDAEDLAGGRRDRHLAQGELPVRPLGQRGPETPRATARASSTRLIRGLSASFSPWPTRLRRQHGDQDHHAGDGRDVPFGAQHLAAGADHVAPGGDVGIGEAEEGQRALEQDGDAP